MKSKILAIIAGLIFTLTLFQTAQAQTTKESSLLAYLVKEANQPDYHSAGDKYLRVTIGNTDYVTELKSGKVVEQNRTGNKSGGFSGTYAEVQINLLDKNKQETAQGAGQILKFAGGKWKRIALSEGNYQCHDLKGIPKAVLKSLKVECN